MSECDISINYSCMTFRGSQPLLLAIPKFNVRLHQNKLYNKLWIKFSGICNKRRMKCNPMNISVTPRRIPVSPARTPGSVERLSNHSSVLSQFYPGCAGGLSARRPTRVVHRCLSSQKTRAPRPKPRGAPPPASQSSCTACGSASFSTAAASCPSP